MRNVEIISCMIIIGLLVPFSLVARSDGPTDTAIEKGLTYTIYKNGNKIIYEGYVDPVNYYDGKAWNAINREITNNRVDAGLYKVVFNQDARSGNTVNISYRKSWFSMSPYSLNINDTVVSYTKRAIGKKINHIFPTETKYVLNDTFLYQDVFGKGFNLTYCYNPTELKMTLFFPRYDLGGRTGDINIVFNISYSKNYEKDFKIKQPVIYEKFKWNADASFNRPSYECFSKLTKNNYVLSFPLFYFDYFRNYPVEIDPTLIINITSGANDAYSYYDTSQNVTWFGGIKTRGATQIGNLAGYYYGWNCTPGETGNATSISAWIKKLSLGTMSAKCCLYYQSNGTLVATTNEVTGISYLTPLVPKVFNFPSPVRIYNVKYFVTIVCDAQYILYGTSKTNDYDDALYVGSYATAFVNPITWTALGAIDTMGSIYCTYTADRYNHKLYFYSTNTSQEINKLQYGSSMPYCGFRFTNISLIGNDVVNSATLMIGTWQLCPSGTVRIIYSGADVDNISVWSTSNSPRNITKTDNKYYYNSSNNDVPNGVYTYRYFNVTVLTNEVLDRSGWNKNNSIGYIFWSNNGTQTSSLLFYMMEATSTNPKLTIVYAAYVPPVARLTISNISPQNVSFVFLNCNVSFNISFRINVTFGWYNISVQMNGTTVYVINSTGNKTVTFDVLDNLSLVTRNYTVYFNGTCTLNSTKTTRWLNVIVQSCMVPTISIIISNVFPSNATLHFYFCNDTFVIVFTVNVSGGSWHNVSFWMNGTLVYRLNATGNGSYSFDVLDNASMQYEHNYTLYYNGTCRGNFTNSSFWINTGDEVFCSSLAFDGDQFLIVVVLNLFGIVFSWGYYSKKRSGGFLMVFAGFLLIAIGVLIGISLIPFAGGLIVPFGIFIIILGLKKGLYGPETEENPPTT